MFDFLYLGFFQLYGDVRFICFLKILNLNQLRAMIYDILESEGYFLFLI